MLIGRTYLFWHLIWVCIEMCDLYGNQSSKLDE
ncbi:hypothetical protein T12_6052 [Trichinella patagoniensis]|uniref:Uncharacterized protein n=1 Tax=Trichinella patagoniensis TaxID=990121 RepID=A0A0V0YSQ6_9BILA|nr:hypothetical protein T12_6052 [Trichinella patagoniensis]